MKNTNALLLAGSLALFSACSSGPAMKADKKFREEAAYNEAAELYKQALASPKLSDRDKKDLNAKIAESYRLSNRPGMALPYYQAAMAAGNKTDSLKYNYAVAAKQAGNLEEAKTLFANYAKDGRRQKWMDRAKMEVANADKVATLPNKTDDYEITNLEALNTTASEYSPIISPSEDLVFTASRGSRIYAQTGTPFTDLYRVKMAEMGTAQPSPVDKVNTENRHEASATYSKDGKTMIFARSNDGERKSATNVDLYICKQDKDGNFSDPELLSVSSDNAWDASPALSADGKTLYFASDRDGGKGGVDLYRATLDANGRYGKPTNLGESINTAGDEQFPYVSEDGKLYFASDGHAGFGGLDLFVASRADGKTTIENLGMPINSKSDDFGIFMKNVYEGYLTSNREGGKGDDDIYAFKNVVLEPKIVRFNAKGVISFRSGGKDMGPLTGARVKLMDNTGKEVAEATTDQGGNFSFPLAEETGYSLLVEKDGYFTKRDGLTTVGKRPSNRELKQKETDISLAYSNSLDKIKLQEAIVIPDIYYDYNMSNITDSAAIELDKVVTMLNDNPGITTELSSHTDSRGDDKYNQKLSKERAESAVAYIVSKGIEKKRITSKGYGELKPIVKNAITEEEFQKNRRTEFKVTKIAK